VQNLKNRITKDQCRDTGMGIVLLLLILFITRKYEWCLIGAIIAHVVNMVVPQIYRPITVIGLGLSNWLGAIISKILLAIVFFVVITPIALIRRLFGKDSLKLRAFKRGQESVMLERNHLFDGADLERPY